MCNSAKRRSGATNFVDADCKWLPIYPGDRDGQSQRAWIGYRNVTSDPNVSHLASTAMSINKETTNVVSCCNLYTALLQN